MEFEKLKNEELKALNNDQMRETETGIRQELAKLRMDIFSEKGKHTGRIRKLKKNLAKILTFKSEKMKANIRL